MSQNISLNRVVFFVGILASVQVISVIAGFAYLSFLHSQIQQTVGDVNYPDKNLTEKMDIASLNGRLANVSAESRQNRDALDSLKASSLYEIANDYQKTQLLNQLLSDYYLQKNSVVVGGNLHVRLQGQRVFSLEIPQQVYAQYPHVSYNSAPSNGGGESSFDTLRLSQGSEVGFSSFISLSLSSGYFTPPNVSSDSPEELKKLWKEAAACDGEYENSVLFAAAVLRKEAPNELSRVQVPDLCKYLVMKKNVPGVWSTYGSTQDLLHYKLDTKPESVSYGFIFDTEKFAADTGDSPVRTAEPRFYVIVGDTSEKKDKISPSVRFRFIRMTWASGFGARDLETSDPLIQKDVKEGKTVLSALEDSVASTSIIAQFCDYVCAY